MARRKSTPVSLPPAALPLSTSRDELRAELVKLARRDATLSQTIDKAQQQIKDSTAERSTILERFWWVKRALETLERVT